MAKRLLVAVLLLAACYGSGTFVGHPGGLTLSPREAVFLRDPELGNHLIMDDRGGVCGAIAEGHGLASTTILDLSIADLDQGPLTPGDYVLDGGEPTSGKVGFGSLWVNDSHCRQGRQLLARGTVTLTEYIEFHDQVPPRGSFNLTFDGEPVTGTFDASICEGSVLNWWYPSGCQ